MSRTEVFDQCEELIRAGAVAKAAHLLGEIKLNQLPNDLRLRMANLCRRVGLVSLGLKALTPEHISDRDEWIRMVTPAEVAEYALLLQRNGSVNEALKILDLVPVQNFPDALLYRAYCLFNRWQYAEAIPILTQYVNRVDGYKKLIGQANLAAALVSTGRNDTAKVLIQELKGACMAGKHHRLLANCYELSAQISMAELDLNETKQALNASSELIGFGQTLDQLYVLKLRAVTEAMETNSPDPLNAFRREAAIRGDWESMRDLDFFRMKLWFDKDRFNHLIFGTPFKAYRERAYQLLGHKPESDTYIFGKNGSRVMDIRTGAFPGEAPMAGGKVHQLMEILLRDFYRPKSVGVLFSELFPDEHFDVFTSADRVHQILRRTRSWIKKTGLPVQLRERSRAYCLGVTGDFGFLLPLNRESLSWNEVQLERMKLKIVPGRDYSARELRETLDLGFTPFRRFTNWAVETGYLSRGGLGPATRYWIPESIRNVA